MTSAVGLSSGGGEEDTEADDDEGVETAEGVVEGVRESWADADEHASTGTGAEIDATAVSTHDAESSIEGRGPDAPIIAMTLLSCGLLALIGDAVAIELVDAVDDDDDDDEDEDEDEGEALEPASSRDTPDTEGMMAGDAAPSPCLLPVCAVSCVTKLMLLLLLSVLLLLLLLCLLVLLLLS